MNEMADRWFSFAEEDLKMAQLALKERLYNSTCFHAQQCAEKALKALIADSDVSIPKSHKLIDLLSKIESPEVAQLRSSLQLSDRFYLPTRYPDTLPGAPSEGLPTEDDAKEVLETARRTLGLVQDLLEVEHG